MVSGVFFPVSFLGKPRICFSSIRRILKREVFPEVRHGFPGLMLKGGGAGCQRVAGQSRTGSRLRRESEHESRDRVQRPLMHREDSKDWQGAGGRNDDKFRGNLANIKGYNAI